MDQGYTKIPNDLLRSTLLSPTAKVAWMLIASMPPGYHPTREQWMAMLPCASKNTWIAAINELVNEGLVAVEQSGTRRVYKIISHQPKGSNSDPFKGSKSGTQKGQKLTPQRVKIWDTKGSKSGTQTVPKIDPYNKTNKRLINTRRETRARMREKVFEQAMIETGCRSVGISVEQYKRLANEIFDDWTFQNLNDGEWNLNHFLSVLRIKARLLNEQPNNNETIQTKRTDRRRPGNAAPVVTEAKTGKF